MLYYEWFVFKIIVIFEIQRQKCDNGYGNVHILSKLWSLLIKKKMPLCLMNCLI